MEQLSRLKLYSDMMEAVGYSSSFYMALNVNIDVLTNIEPLFLSDDDSPEVNDYKDPRIVGILNQNIQTLRKKQYDSHNVYTLVESLSKLVEDYAEEDSKGQNYSRRLFNQIINRLVDFNQSSVLRNELPPCCVEKGEMPQVFLSHAYDDKLYAGALFNYFYRKGIYLYIDWMHRGKIKDGRILKEALNNELRKSKQLLFLRTVNSELNIQGKQTIRPWCSWELGNFYSKDGQQKYMVNLYSVVDYGKGDALQLHGIKLYTGVSNGLLMGREIIAEEV